MRGRALGKRIRRWLWAPGGLLALALALSASAQPVPPPAGTDHCKSNALGEWWCAENELGTAVVDGLGRVVCAPGACIRDDDSEWHCARAPGGDAGWSPEAGASCDGGCESPEGSHCEKL